jgi:hypothetical protein
MNNSFNKRKQKKGQIEMFGLAVIVILISIGFFIFVSFKSNQKPENVQKEFTTDKMADDFVLSILQVSVAECPQFSINDLIIDCVRDNRLECGFVKSCYALNRSINIMLNKTFEVQGRKFRFYSEGIKYHDGLQMHNYELLNITKGGCGITSNQGRAGRAIISTYPGPTVKLYLNICY